MGSVIIVGGGPAGVTLAYLLARRGVAVTLLEKEVSFDRVFRGEALMPLGLEALAQMNIAIDHLPGRLINSWEMFVANKPSLTVPEPQAELGQRAVRILSQPAYLEYLVSLARQSARFQLHMGAAVRDLIEEDGRICGVQATIDGVSQTLRADMVVGCDGRGSLLRTRAGLGLELLPESYDVLWFRFPTPAERQGQTDVLMMASVANTALAYNSFDDHMRYALVIPKGGASAIQPAELPARLAEPAPAWLASHIRALGEQIGTPNRLNVIVGRANQWHKPGLLLIGDAAHPMSPIRAQGINLALRDVVVAANHLTPLLRDNAPGVQLDAAAARIEAERLPEIRRAQALQLREARGQFNERWKPFLIWLAGTLGPAMGRYAFAQRAWLAQQTDLRFGTVPVQLTV
ncbi:MAG: FAD-dependent oxidoreductase [Anaerolineales bacterium]|nr:FAD-dependent oxidoreductase [Anaerolineales bacterium]